MARRWTKAEQAAEEAIRADPMEHAIDVLYIRYVRNLGRDAHGRVDRALLQAWQRLTMRRVRARLGRAVPSWPLPLDLRRHFARAHAIGGALTGEFHRNGLRNGRGRTDFWSTRAFLRVSHISTVLLGPPSPPPPRPDGPVLPDDVLRRLDEHDLRVLRGAARKHPNLFGGPLGARELRHSLSRELRRRAKCAAADVPDPMNSVTPEPTTTPAGVEARPQEQ